MIDGEDWRHGDRPCRHIVFEVAEVAVPRAMFRQVLDLTEDATGSDGQQSRCAPPRPAMGFRATWLRNILLRQYETGAGRRRLLDPKPGDVEGR